MRSGHYTMVRSRSSPRRRHLQGLTEPMPERLRCASPRLDHDPRGRAQGGGDGAGVRRRSTTRTIISRWPGRWRRARASSFKGRPTAYRPPLYPLILVPAVAPGQVGTVGHRAFASGPGRRHRLDDSGGGRRVRSLASPGDGRRTHRGLRSGARLAEPLGDDRDAGRLPRRRGPRRAGTRGPSGAVLGGLGFGLAALCRPSLLAGAALTILAGLFAPPGVVRERIERAAADRADDRGGPPALDDPQPRRPRGSDLDDDARRLHVGAGQQPGLLPRGPRRAARPGLDGRGPVALVGLGEP